MRPSAYRLTAVIDKDSGSLELKASPFSHDRLDSLLKDDPIAITLEPLGHPLANRLLQALRYRRPAAQRSHSVPRTRAARWRCYKTALNAPAVQWVTPVEAPELKRRVADLCSRTPGVIAVFIAEDVLNDAASASAIDKAMAGAIATGGDDAIFHRPTADVRRAVLADRRALLAEVPTYSAIEIGRACDSMNCNLSQRAAELRMTHRLFGLRAGWSWRYPKFQFGPELHIYPEMRQILLNLPDEQGWERLQWFITPSESLHGRTPLEAWPDERKQIVEIAMTENWRDSAE